MNISNRINLPLGAMLSVLMLTSSYFASNVSAKELKMATFMSPKHPINKGVLPHLTKKIAAETGGTLKLKLYPSGQLGKGPKAQYKRVLDNVAEITFGIQGYTPTIFPRTMVVAQPGVGESSQEVTQKIWNVYDKYLKSEYTKVKVLALFSNWPPVLITRKKAVTKMSDVKGLKIRAPSAVNISQLKSWGAVGVSMPVSKIYNAFQTGVVDGVYISPGALYKPWRLAEPGEYVAAGMNGPTSLFFIAMNKKVWDGLSNTHKAAVNKHTGQGYSAFAANYWGSVDAKQLATAKSTEKGVKFTQLSKSAVAEFDAATARSVETFLATSEKKGIPARAIYEAAKK